MLGKPGPPFFCWFPIAGAQGHPGTAWAQVWANAAALLSHSIPLLAASLPALCLPCASLLPTPSWHHSARPSF